MYILYLFCIIVNNIIVNYPHDLEKNHLFEDTTITVAPNFSFDGPNAGRIFFEGETQDLVWKYSLDGGTTWKMGDGYNYKLSDEEINSITEENNIKIQTILNGQETDHTINIQKGIMPNLNPYVNDWENRLINPGDVSKTEWKIEGSDSGWTSYTEQEPVVKGANKLLVRTRATGTYTASDTREYNFNEDNQTDTRKYLSIKHLSIHQVSSQATGSGQNGNVAYAIDGDARTRWHSDWNGNDTNKFIVIKLDEPKYLSALEFMPASGGNGKIESAQILISMDGENWVEVVSETNWTYRNGDDVTEKSVDFTPTKGQYIKIVGKRTQAASANKNFIAAKMLRLYEDSTKEEGSENVTPTFEFKVEQYQLNGKYITGIRPGIHGENATTVKEFKANITTNQELSILNQKGDVLKDDDIITTGMTIQVGENLTYTLVVRGDVDGDGNITINDLAQLKLYVIELVTFDEVSLKAANVDLDEENEISINDLSVLKLLLIGL